MITKRDDVFGDTAVVSLGPSCFGAWLLKKMDNQLGPMPFDWLGSDPEMVSECIEDNFSSLLNPELWYPQSVHAGVLQHGHYLYSSRFKLRVIFGHQDPTTTVGRKYYQICVAGFQQLLISDRRKVFLLVVDWRYADRARDTALQKLLNCLSNRTRDFKLLLIKLSKVSESALEATITKELEIGKLSIYSFTPTSERKNGLTFLHEADNEAISKFLASYVATTFSTHLANTKK